jgi:hypothetical protein
MCETYGNSAAQLSTLGPIILPTFRSRNSATRKVKKDLAAKTHRGLRGRVEQGKSCGGVSYGCEVVRQLNSQGALVRGDRAIIPHEAEIVRRIFKAFADGKGPRAVAKRLNDEGVPGPGGAPWIDTAIRGPVKRGTGLVNNEFD